MAADDDLTFDFEHQLEEEEPGPLAALPVRSTHKDSSTAAAAAPVCLRPSL
jgi:hypothetical protein